MRPVRGSAWEVGVDILMAPGPGGSLYVSIPRPGGSVLVLLDGSGRARPGWPITVKNSTACGRPLPAADGSVRIICDGTDLPQFDNDPSDIRAFAFDPGGQLLAGWPVQLRPGAANLVGDKLTYVQLQMLTDTYNDDTVSHEAWLTTVTADGAIRSGKRTPMTGDCCGSWAVSPGGVGYLTNLSGLDTGSAEVSRVTAIDLSGTRAGWPVEIDGIASGPAFGPGGRTVLTVGSAIRGTSRVVVFEGGGKAISARSAELRFATVESGVDCVAAFPEPPVVAQDGTIFLYSWLDSAVLALDPSLKVLPGWPFRPATPLMLPGHEPAGEDGIFCRSLAIPAAGPDGTLYLPLQALDKTVGGSLVAVGKDGRVVAGWPVGLRRPGAEFWSVVVGSDGTVHALAVEPEAGGTSSASVLAIAPDSTVLYTATIIDP